MLAVWRWRRWKGFATRQRPDRAGTGAPRDLGSERRTPEPGRDGGEEAEGVLRKDGGAQAVADERERERQRSGRRGEGVPEEADTAGIEERACKERVAALHERRANPPEVPGELEAVERAVVEEMGRRVAGERPGEDEGRR